MRANSISPMTMMSTAVPLPLRTMVLSMKHSSPMKSTGTMTCRVRSTGGTSTTSQLVSRARSRVRAKQMT